MKRNPRLEGLRGIGALAVLILHVECLSGLYRGTPRGYLGVDFFFQLSGVVIAARYQDDLANGQLKIGQYIRTRFLRLYPLMALGVMIGGSLAALGLLDVAPIGPTFVAQMLVLPVLASGAFAFPLDAPEWSLHFEFIVNVCHALGAKIRGPALQLIFVVFAIALLAAIMSNGSADFGSMTSNFAGGFVRAECSFILGMLLYRQRGSPLSVGRPALVDLIAIAAIPLTLIALEWSRLPTDIGDSIAIFLIFPAILFLSLKIEPASSGLSTFLTWLGGISYPLYIIHYPLAQAFSKTISEHALSSAGKLYAWALLTVIMIALAAWVERFVEKPLRRQVAKVLPVDAHAAAENATRVDRHQLIVDVGRSSALVRSGNHLS